jgi:HAD superfamily hydrolase (TIGR01509 family)
MVAVSAVVGMVPGVHEDGGSTLSSTPPTAVLFDFHGTLAQVEGPVAWVSAAAASCGRELDRAAATALSDRLLTAGRPGGPPPHRVPPQLAELYADRDLYEYAHRAAYQGLSQTVPTDIEGLSEALYERLLIPAGWHAYRDTVSTLASLHDRGIPVAVVSNIGFDMRPLAEAMGFAPYVKAYVLSYELGRTKPDPAVFRHACTAIGADPELTLMVGDSAADAGALRAGCRTYLLPECAPGTDNGLAAILSLIRA